MSWGSGGWGNAGGSSQARSWQTSTPTNPFTQGMQQALGVATGFAAPSLLQNELAASQLAGQLGYNDAQYGLGVSQLNENTALDRARLGLNANDIGIDRDSIMRQMGVEDQLHALAGQLFGIDRQGLDLNQSGINSRLGAQNRGFDRQRYQELSDKTVKGSVGSVMHRRNNADITANQHDAWDAFWRDTAGNNLEKEKVGVAEKQAGINSKESKAKLADRLKVLDNEAGKLGIDAKQLEANLSQGLARLGIDRMFTMDNLLDAMQSNDIDRQAIAQQIFRDAMGMSQFFEGQLGGSPTTPTGGVTGSSGGSGLTGGSSGRATTPTGGGSW